MVTSETVPFSKSGGLADVVGALSSSISKLENKVSVFMPMYSFIDKAGFEKNSEITVDMLGKREKATIMEKTLNDVTYLALDHPYFSERAGIYGDTSFAPYSDNCPRFLFFAKAVINYIKATKDSFDIVHCHDWTAGIVPYLIKQEKLKAKSVFTIHNLAYQGEFSSYDGVLSNIVFSPECLNGERINMLKSGLSFSDKITTVSPTYAKEIQTEEFGCGLDWLLKERKEDLSGIINGIDYNEWNPENDKFFSEHFTSTDLSGKEKLKARIQKENKLKEDSNIPLFAMISRLAEQKGFTELLLSGETSALERILRDNRCQFIIVGTGDDRYVSKLKELEERYNNLKVLIQFSNSVAHTLEGAADFFLMPSRYEPCGLNQLYSLHYATLPVAHRIGGLADTIKDIDENGNGTGFLFDKMDEDTIVKAVNRAIDFFDNKEKLNKARIKAMNEDFTWTHSANEYIQLYDIIDNSKD